MSSYSELLKDPRWQKRRLEIFQRDRWTCQFCWSKTKTLHLHHIDYLSGKPPWEAPDDFLITLCETCHETEERLKSGNYNMARHAALAKMPIIKLNALLYSFVFMRHCKPDEFEKIVSALDSACRGDNYKEFKEFLKAYT